MGYKQNELQIVEQVTHTERHHFILSPKFHSPPPFTQVSMIFQLCRFRVGVLFSGAPPVPLLLLPLQTPKKGGAPSKRTSQPFLGGKPPSSPASPRQPPPAHACNRATRRLAACCASGCPAPFASPRPPLTSPAWGVGGVGEPREREKMGCAAVSDGKPRGNQARRIFVPGPSVGENIEGYKKETTK